MEKLTVAEISQTELHLSESRKVFEQIRSGIQKVNPRQNFFLSNFQKEDIASQQFVDLEPNTECLVRRDCQSHSKPLIYLYKNSHVIVTCVYEDGVFVEVTHNNQRGLFLRSNFEPL